MTDRTGRVAVVTGGGRGIGRAIALHLGDLGLRVVVNDVGADIDGEGLDRSVASSVADEINGRGGVAIPVTASVATAEGAAEIVGSTVDKFGRLDVLVNNAAIMRAALVVDMTETDWDMVCDVNLRGAFLCTRQAAPVMIEQRHGRIINMSSLNALGKSRKTGTVDIGRGNYAASKAGILGFTWAMAVELKPHGITCNAVLPTANTRLMVSARLRREAEGRLADGDSTEDYDPHDVARVVAALAMPGHDHLTGRVLHAVRDEVAFYEVAVHQATNLAAESTPESLLGQLAEIVDL